jgi:CHASE2 domain-containing sensor protein/predicted Ser/Thr protein kinase
MAKKPPLSSTDVLTSTAPATASRSRQVTQVWLKRLNLSKFSHTVVGAWAVLAALATLVQPGIVQRMERQAQITFFSLRGAVPPPADVVILKLDEYTLSQAKNAFGRAPGTATVEGLKWPLERAVYARVIDRLMSAGAAAVVVDVLFVDPSSYGSADDEALSQVLRKYPGRVTLAATYEDGDIRQGALTQIIRPLSIFETQPASVGTINYWREANGRIHSLGNQFAVRLAKYNPEYAEEYRQWSQESPSLAEAALKAAQRSSPNLTIPPIKGSNIYFYGPSDTFDQVPFWDVIDPNNWNTYLEKGGYFKNKIVLIGPMAISLGDRHDTPFSTMYGVEIHANSIAGLLQGRSISDALPNPATRSLLVLLGVAVAALIQSRWQRGVARFGVAMVITVAWGAVGYVAFTAGYLILPVAVPMAAIALGGLSYLTIYAADAHLKKLKLRRTLRSYAGAPIVQEILSQQDDLHDLLPTQQQEGMVGRKLGNRYRIVAVLSSGGFGETYIGEDTQRPGNPKCVVKRLRPTSNSPRLIQLARRLFNKEAETLERLGTYEQIPQLLAYFEEDEEFYLIQECIDGRPLSQELPLGKQLPESSILAILRELLQILEFIHSQGVIHRDIKPSNIIRRRSDNKLVLIDFGAVKELHTQLVEGEEHTGLTIGIGTRGYMPPEQCVGNPRFNSDIYAVGMTAIQALSGLPPSQLQEDSKTGEILWRHRVQVSHGLASVLSKMVRYDFNQRYQSATEVLQILEQLMDFSNSSLALADIAGDMMVVSEQPATSTLPWPDTFGSSPDTLEE